jgi:hypothetical protein
MRKKQLIGEKPAYYRGQLLLEDDFIAEQRYHAQARYRHTRNLHGWGIARGLDVTAAGDSAVSVSPGFAIDAKGHEIELSEAETLDLSSLPAGALVSISLAYATEDPAKARDKEKEPRIECYGVLSASTGIAEGAVLLATVQLDENGKLTSEALSKTNTRYLHTLLTPGSVTASALDERLRRGWLRLPFRPSPIPPGRGDPHPPPPFRIGPTEARAYRYYPTEKTENTRGCGGTMAIPLPPGVIKAHRLRIAGITNEKTMMVSLWLGGWDVDKKEHVARALVDDKEIRGSPYDETYDLGDIDISLECSTMSVEVRSEGYVAVSLVAVEISY